VFLFCFFAAFCHVPTIEAATSGPYRLRLQVTHLDIEDTSILFAYKIIYRQLGSPSWNVKISRRSLFSPRINLITSFLKPYRNYTVRVFPYSLLGDRLGSKLRMFQTTEKGEQGVFFKLYYSVIMYIYLVTLFSIFPLTQINLCREMLLGICRPRKPADVVP